MSAEIRASDEDRERVIDLLQRHTAAGRLTIDEFSDRAGHVYSARTLADLATATRDLPAESTRSDAESMRADAEAAQPGTRVRNELLVLFAVAIATLLLLIPLMQLRR